MDPLRRSSLTPRLTPATQRPTGGTAPRFGLTVASVTDSAFQWVQKTRTREMLLEDFVGFGFLRTTLDLFRQFIFKESPDNKRQLNVPAARERFIRETASIFTDNFSGGMVAWGIAAGAGKFLNKPNMANQFASNETWTLFNDLLKKSPNREAFVQQLSATLSDAAGSKAETSKIADRLRRVMLATDKIPATKALREAQSGKLLDTAVDFVKNFKKVGDKTTLDLAIGQHNFPIDKLLEDGTHFLQYTHQHAGSDWAGGAEKLLKRTQSISRSRVVVGLGFALGATFLVPIVNSMLTRKVDQMESYPGELGLGQMKAVNANEKKSFFAKHFPHITESLAAGNPVPALLTLLPLYAFIGLDSLKLSSGNIAHAFINPFKKANWSKIGSMLQFGKGFPFTTQQQMASCYAFLIFSRLWSARSENEYRERFMDSFVLGWGLWILGTPFMKRAIAGIMARKNPDQNLLKKVFGDTYLKRRIEIERLGEKLIGSPRNTLLQQGIKSQLGKFVVLSGASTVATIGLLGIVEPIIAMKWTEFHANKKKSRLAAEEAAKRSLAARPAGAMPAFRAIPTQPATPTLTF